MKLTGGAGRPQMPTDSQVKTLTTASCQTAPVTGEYRISKGKFASPHSRRLSLTASDTSGSALRRATGSMLKPCERSEGSSDAAIFGVGSDSGSVEQEARANATGRQTPASIARRRRSITDELHSTIGRAHV